MHDEARNDELAELLFRSGRGDQKAFRRLYELTAPILFAACRRLLQRRELAEEALQEAYVAVWHRASDFTPMRGAVMTWMASIARNRAIDLRRRDNRRPEHPLFDDELEARADGSPGPLQYTIGADDAVALDRCMELLSETQQRCIRLAFFQGLTHAELSQRLTQPLGTVKSWIRRGLEGLKQCLQG